MINQLDINSDKIFNNQISYHGDSIIASRKKLSELFGKPIDANSGDGKVNYEWNFVYTDEHGNKEEINLYDWKEYREVPEEEDIYWNIGSRSKRQSSQFADYLKNNYNLLTSSINI